MIHQGAQPSEEPFFTGIITFEGSHSAGPADPFNPDED